MKLRAFTIGYPAFPMLIWNRSKRYFAICFIGVLVFDYVEKSK